MLEMLMKGILLKSAHCIHPHLHFIHLDLFFFFFVVNFRGGKPDPNAVYIM